jgi:hypothetical protein
MRSIALLGLAAAAAACSGDDTGLVLTIRAPDVPDSARRIEVVLASADPAEIVMADGQINGGSVRYYSQKSTAGMISLPSEKPRLDGFVVRIEGRDGGGSESFVPLVFAYAGEQPVDGEQPIAAGAVLGEDELPIPVDVPAGSRLEATAHLLSYMPAAPDLGVMNGQILEVRCRSNAGEVRSGVAWQRPDMLQLRLLRPDPAGDSPLDATARKLDLDCDGFAADVGDCDDVRAPFNPRAAEKCDGEDMNCDGSSLAIVPCSLTPGTCDGETEGVLLCSDVDKGKPLTTCQLPSGCECVTGSCSRCALSFEPGSASGSVKPCSPGVSVVQLPAPCDADTRCTVEVLHADMPWRAAVAFDAPAPFERSTVVARPLVYLRVKLEALELPKPTTPIPSLGGVYLAISRDGAPPQYFRVDLYLGTSGTSGACSGVALPGGNYRMDCNL